MRIAMVLFDGMTALDAVGPAQAWSFLPDAQIEYVAGAVGPVATDCGFSLTATHDYSTAAHAPDVIFVGGAGKATMAAMQDDALLSFLRDRGSRARWITSVCTGSLILGAAGLLNGYKAATYWGLRDQLDQFGATLSDERVCIDRNRLTGGGITSGIDFGIRIAGHWAGEDTGRMIELLMEYRPQPPYGTGHPDIADDATLKRVQAMLAAEMA